LWKKKKQENQKILLAAFLFLFWKKKRASVLFPHESWLSVFYTDILYALFIRQMKRKKTLA